VICGVLTPLRHAEPRAPSRLSEFPASGSPVHAPPGRRPLGLPPPPSERRRHRAPGSREPPRSGAPLSLLSILDHRGTGRGPPRRWPHAVACGEEHAVSLGVDHAEMVSRGL